MLLWDYLRFYWYLLLASLRIHDSESWEKKAERNDLYAKYQTTSDRNAYWMALSSRDRAILAEFILLATIGKCPATMHESLINIMDEAAANGRLVANTDND